MNWDEIRKAYPNQWLIIEALEAHTTINHFRQLDRLAVIERCTDGASALACYRALHQQYSQREFYFVHTARTLLDIREQSWFGIRRGHAAAINGRAH